MRRKNWVLRDPDGFFWTHGGVFTSYLPGATMFGSEDDAAQQGKLLDLGLTVCVVTDRGAKKVRHNGGREVV